MPDILRNLAYISWIFTEDESAKLWGSSFPKIAIIVFVLLISIFVLIVNNRSIQREFFKSEDLEEDPSWWENLRHSSHRKLIIPPNCENFSNFSVSTSDDKAVPGNTVRSKSFVLRLKGMTAKKQNKRDFFESNEFTFISSNFPSENFTPLLCFVNSESGGNQGKMIMAYLKRLLNPIQVYDLKKKNANPANALLKYKEFLPELRLLVS
jgi:hypothetical protein